MNQFRKFMYGRYGFDQLSQVLIITSLILSLVGSLFRSNTLIYISYLPLAYGIFRILSKDIQRRAQENNKLNIFLNKWKSKLNKEKRVLQGTKTHRFYKCPKCRKTIRVPKGKGKICITCPVCKTEFVKRT